MALLQNGLQDSMILNERPFDRENRTHTCTYRS